MIYFSNWVVLYPIAVCLFIALRLHAGSRDDGRRSVSLTFQLVVLIFLLFALLSIGLRASFLSAIWVTILFVISIVLFIKNRRLDRSALLLSMLNAQNQKEWQVLAEAFYSGNVGYVRRRARRLREYLDDSLDWSQALEMCGIAKSSYEKLGVRLQAHFGVTEANQLGADPEQRAPMVVEQEMERMFGRVMIFSWILPLFPTVVAYAMFVLPSFVQVLADFDVEQPPLMISIVAVSNQLSSYGWLSLFAILSVGLLALTLMAVTLWILPQASSWPILRWLCRDYHRNLGFIALSHASTHELELGQACHTAAKIIPVKFIAERYRSAGDRIQGGEVPSLAFRKAGVLTHREIESLGLGLDAHQPSWGLQQVANWNIDRMLRKYSTAVQLLVVLMTLTVGLFVALFASAVLHSLALMVLEFANVDWI